MMTFKKTLAALGLSTFVAGGAFAGVSAEDAARLGQDLTPMGAEMAGNADGSIPAWNPGGTPIPADYVAGSGNYTNPYKDEQPLYTIDGNNYMEYAEVLSEGSKAMFEKYGADGFKMNVYPSHRGYKAPDWLYANNVKNATGASLVADGQKIDNNYPGVPFPVPQSGLEVLWNHMIRYGVEREYEYDVYYVGSNGKPVLSTTGVASSSYPMFREPDKLVGDTPWTQLRINYNAPARRAGEILLVHEPGADYTAGKGRMAWQYLVGQRRVRLAPAVSFDTPNPGVAGTSTYDDSFIYNGSPERFDWKLVGKKEIIVPANAYDFVFQQKVEDLLGEKFLKPEFIRYEKQRVWIVEGDLKEGSRHLYSKRRFYIVEDSWTALTGETYDARGNLWRVQYAYPANLYDVGGSYSNAYGGYDLLQNIYNLNGKAIPGKFTLGLDRRNEKYFSPKGMARSGVR
ncbi:MAG: DUF1329 domain-containing protein [Halioglobus sp.]